MSLSRKAEAELARGIIDAMIVIVRAVLAASISTDAQISAALRVRDAVRSHEGHRHPTETMGQILHQRFEKFILTL
jgi:hypothetical protein